LAEQTIPKLQSIKKKNRKSTSNVSLETSEIASQTGSKNSTDKASKNSTDKSSQTSISSKDSPKSSETSINLETKSIDSQAIEENQIPVKWCPPEVIESHNFSTKSDVWSYGILCWEIYEYGAAPYYWLNNKQAAESIKNGERLAHPPAMPLPFYNLVLKCCWQNDPENRVTFQEILIKLQGISFVVGNDLKEKEKKEIETLKENSASEKKDQDNYNNS